MRSLLAATWMFVAMGASAQAQLTPPATAGTKPKPVATVPIRPALQTPADTANAMAQTERLAIQSDLAWVGQYNGAITGEVSERMVAAIKEFQKGRGGKQTGVLNPQERGLLAETAKRKQENVGWKIVTDMGTGARLGVPAKLVPQQSTDANGSKWTSTTGTVQIQLSRRKEANPATAKLAEQEKKEPAGRKMDYSVVKPDFFVLSGLQGLKKFYVRGTFKGDEVRILTILYDQATENTVEPVVIAMSSAFNPFPAGAQAAGAAAAQERRIRHRHRRQRRRRHPRRPPGHRQLPHGRDRGPWQRRPRRRGQGSRSHAAAHLRRARIDAAEPCQGRGKIRRRTDGNCRSAEPGWRCRGEQRQGLGHAGRRRQRSGAVAGPALGFRRRGTQYEGKFAGVALLKPVVVAGPGNATAAALVSADTVRGFLRANGVTSTGGSADARASVVRVICVRK